MLCINEFVGWQRDLTQEGVEPNPGPVSKLLVDVINDLKRNLDPLVLSASQDKLEALPIAIAKHLQLPENELPFLTGDDALQFFNETNSFGPFTGKSAIIGEKIREIIQGICDINSYSFLFLQLHPPLFHQVNTAFFAFYSFLRST